MHIKLIILGIIFLLIGLSASLYLDKETIEPEIIEINHHGRIEIPGHEIVHGYPYRDLGLVFILGGIICISLGAVYSSKKNFIFLL